MADAPVPLQTPPDKEVYGIFAGPIDQAAINRISNGIAVASSNSVTHIHMAFHTLGGDAGAGVALFNLLRAATMPTTLYNFGTVASAGVTAFLGASNRVASIHANFMIHRVVSPALAATSERLNAMARSVVLDDARTEAIFVEAKLKISAEQRAVHNAADLWLSADEALAANLITEIKEFAPPKGVQLFFLGMS